MTGDAGQARVDRQVLHQRLLLAERSVPSSAAPMLVVSALAAWLGRRHVAAPLLWGWLGFTWLVIAGRIALARRQLAAPPPVAQAAAMLRRMVLLALPGGLTLLAANLIFFRADDHAVTLFLAVVPMLAFTGQVAAAAPPLPVIAALLGPGMLALVGLCLVDGQVFTRYMALVLALFSVAMLRISRNVGRAYDREIRLSLSNQALAAELEAASRAKSRFLAAASHDIRQPVHALGLFLGAFDAGTLQGRNAALITPLRECAASLREMLDGVLDLSRAESSTLQVTPSPVPVQALLDLAERDFAPLAEAKGLALRCVPSRAHVRADALLLERIVRNLVSNAVRYTRHGGVLIGARRRGGDVRIEVWDTGPGIADDESERIFGEFERGRDTAASAQGGLGLGLAIARHFAQAMQAELSLASRRGRGSVFRLALPAAPPPAMAAAVAAPPPLADLTGLKVLLVDDDAAVRAATEQLLRDWGCEVQSAAAPDAWQPAGVPDVVVTDNQIGGRERAHELAERVDRHAGRSVPLVVATGAPAAGRLSALAEAGAVVLVKPVDPQALRLGIARQAGRCR